MIIDARQLPESETLTADICIVGGGPAGITIAHELIGSGLQVILAEAGGATHGQRPAALAYAGEVENCRHAPLERHRGRGLGGSTALWNGSCLPFDPIDFEPRGWVPLSGWPMSRRDLEPAFRRALDYCEAGSFTWRAAEALQHRPAGMIPGLDDAMLLNDAIERFSPPQDFGRRYRRALASSANVRVLLHADCMSVALSAFGNRVDILRMASTPGRKFSIQVAACVLAAGGLETTRLLLLSDDVISPGIGNRNGLLGRFYMCQLEGRIGAMKLNSNIKDIVHCPEIDPQRVYCRRRLCISEEAQRTGQLLNFTARITHPPIADPAHGSGILSAMYLRRSLSQSGAMPSHLGNMLADSPALLAYALRRLTRRQLPFTPLSNRDNVFHLKYTAEQRPNSDSRVLLVSERDPYGRRRLKVDWRTTAADRDNLVACARLMAERLRASGLGDLAFDEEELRANYGAVGGQHMGTVRMAEDASQGVVDPDGRVFGVENLFVASSATFPTSGAAGPTLTLLALSLRLAAHLRATVIRRNAEPMVSVMAYRPLYQKDIPTARPPAPPG